VIPKKLLLAFRFPAASAVLASSFPRELVSQAAADVGVAGPASPLREEECAAARGGLVALPEADFPAGSSPVAGLAGSAEAGWVRQLAADFPAGSSQVADCLVDLAADDSVLPPEDDSPAGWAGSWADC
jgi:hypothetical protein